MSTSHLPTILPTPPPPLHHGIQEQHAHHNGVHGHEHEHEHMGAIGVGVNGGGTTTFFPSQPIDAGAEQGLAALGDSPAGAKPFYPYSTLIRYAIKGSPGQRLLLEDIYYAIESRFPYFRSAPAGWKNSVRHNLSLNPCFEKVPRPLTDRGKGSYWVVNDHIDPRTGVHRIRKKKGSTRGVGSSSRAKASAGRNAAAYQPDYNSSNGEFRYEGEQVDGAPPNGFAHSFDPESTNTVYPLIPAQPVRYPEEGGEDEIEAEVDPSGNPNWRVIWLNELAKLQAVTSAQDNAGGDPEWYRMMTERVRSAFAVDVVPHSHPHHSHSHSHSSGFAPQASLEHADVELVERSQQGSAGHLHVQSSADPAV